MTFTVFGLGDPTHVAFLARSSTLGMTTTRGIHDLMNTKIFFIFFFHRFFIATIFEKVFWFSFEKKGVVSIFHRFFWKSSEIFLV